MATAEAKLFPQEMMPLEEPPLRFTKQVHLRLHTAHLKPEQLGSVARIDCRASGQVSFVSLLQLHARGPGHFCGNAREFAVAPSRELQQAADGRFGKETYYAKVDTSLPERTPRRWERREESNGNGG